MKLSPNSCPKVLVCVARRRQERKQRLTLLQRREERTVEHRQTSQELEQALQETKKREIKRNKEKLLR